MKLLSVGTVAFDSIETPFGKRDKIVGGSCTYIAHSASYFVEESALSAVVGDDFPNEEIKKFKDKGVNLEGFQILEGKKSFFWAGKYHYDMNSRDTIDTQLNVLQDFDPILTETLRNVEFLMLGNLMPSLQNKILDQLINRPTFIVLDTMNIWMGDTLNDLKEVMKRVDLITINDEEARLLSGEYSLRKAAKKILTMGPKYLVIKKGEHGALLFHKEDVFYVPALPIEDVIDPTGAGDTFAGGMIGYLAKTNDVSFNNIKNAIVIGSAMASFVVEKFGTERIENLSKEEIFERILKFKELTEFNFNNFTL